MSLQELQEMVGEISPEEKNLLEQVKLKRFFDYRLPDELKNEATRLGMFAPENILRDGLTGLLNYYSKEYIRKLRHQLVSLSAKAFQGPRVVVDRFSWNLAQEFGVMRYFKIHFGSLKFSFRYKTGL